MANKLSTILGASGGGGGGTASAFVDTGAMPLLDYQEMRSTQFSTAQGGVSGWNQYASNIDRVGDLNKAGKNQFGINFLANNSQDTNRIYHTIIPFQVDDNGTITPGSANTIENSSGTSISTTFAGRGFNNTTSQTKGSGNIGANTAGFISYGRMHWNGSYYCMSWGGTISTSNTVSVHDRTPNSDYTSSYPHPNEGIFGRSGGGDQTPYYHVVGYDGNSYNYWSGWYYNSGSHPSHWTQAQLATYSSTCGYHNLPQSDDSTWDWAGYYKYYYTGDQYGFGTVNCNGNYSNQVNSMRSMWTGKRNGTDWTLLGWRMKQDLGIIYDWRNQEFYTWNPTSGNAMNEGYGSSKKVDMDDRNDFNSQTYGVSSWFQQNSGSFTMRQRKPWEQPTTAGALTTNDEVIYDNYYGMAVRRVTYDTSTNKLKSRVIYHRPITMSNKFDAAANGPYFENTQWCRAGSSDNILVTIQYEDTPAKFIVRTYDATSMIDKIAAAE